MAANNRSARAHTAARSRVLRARWSRWRSAPSSSCASGLPTTLERPITTASRPSSEACTLLASRMQPSGVQGAKPGIPVASRPILTGEKPSTSLSGCERRHHGRGHPHAGGSGSCTRMPCTRRIGVELAHQRDQLGLADASPAAGDRTSACRPRRSPWSCCAHRFRSPHRCRPAPPPAPAPGRARADRLFTCAATCARSAAAIALPSMIRAPIGLVLRRPAALRHRAFRQGVKCGFPRGLRVQRVAHSSAPRPLAGRGYAACGASRGEGPSRAGARNGPAHPTLSQQAGARE